jgi:Holliday junction resolvasome RuvABC endonuclease subunit
MVLSVDPGLSNYGYAVWNAYGELVKVGILQTKKTKKKITRVSDDYASRIASLTLQLNQIITDNAIKAVLGELPILGGQNASAVRDMAVSVAISMSVFTMLNLPIEWCTPTEVKVALAGHNNSTKKEMMVAACKKHSWKITTKPIYAKKTGKLQRLDIIYHPMGIAMGANKFEHIADAVGVAHALKNGNIVKMYLNKRR